MSGCGSVESRAAGCGGGITGSEGCRFQLRLHAGFDPLFFRCDPVPGARAGGGLGNGCGLVEEDVVVTADE